MEMDQELAEIAERTEHYKAHPDAALEIIQDIHSTFHRYLCDPTEEPVCAKPVEVLEVFEYHESTGSGKDLRLRFRAKVRCSNGVVGVMDTSEMYYHPHPTEGQPADYECSVEFEAEG